MAYVVFDLDGTVIDSDHRKLTRADGSLDLDHWRENCTREKIFADTLLPLAESMKRLYDRHTIIVCTARVMTQADWDFLEAHNLRFHFALSRNPLDSRNDAAMKVAMMCDFFRNLDLTLAEANIIMFDDNVNVIRAMLASRVHCFDATIMNERATRKREA